jgi:hypothetical protein
MQDYFQDDEISYLQNEFGDRLHRVSLMYIPKNAEGEAPLNFHLTASEKKEVHASLFRQNNEEAIAIIKSFLKE